jgi:hypothetical protein
VPCHGDEVRHEVERHREIDEGKRRPQLPATRHAGVAQQPLEEDRAVGDQAGDHADVPLARTKDKHGDQGAVGHEQDAGADEQPGHRSPRTFRTCSSWVFGEAFGIT